jgi:hypothetical protein
MASSSTELAIFQRVAERGSFAGAAEDVGLGGLGGYARYIAVCPSDWPYGVAVGRQDAPLPKSDKPLHYDAAAGMRIR